MGLRCLILLVFIIGFIKQDVKGEGLIEVFQWKQMDFYNRGDNSNAGLGTGIGSGGSYGGGGSGGSYGGGVSGGKKGSIVFPDQRPSYAGSQRFKRAPEVMTSRDQPKNINFDSRFNPTSNRNSSASYIPYNNVPMGVTHHQGRLFVTMPRRRIGIPSTLNYVDMRSDGQNPSPKLHAYPDFVINQLDPNLQGNPAHIVSVYRTTVDACNRLWFIDTGMLEYPDNRMQIQRPAIWILDVNTDRVIRTFEIPLSVVETGRGLASITVDVMASNCDEAFAYIPDLVENRLYVYSYHSNRLWSFAHNYFNFDPLAGDLSVGGQTFRWDDGIFSVTLGPRQPNGYRPAMFHPMASHNEFIVSTQVLQNETNAARSDHGNDFQLLGNRGTSRQSTMHEYDPKTGVIFYAEIQRNAVGCWNSRKPFNAANQGTVASDANRMIYPSDLTIDTEGIIWVMTNSMPIFIYSTLDTNIVNYRVWKQNVNAAAANTVCA